MGQALIYIIFISLGIFGFLNNQYNWIINKKLLWILLGLFIYTGILKEIK